MPGKIPDVILLYRIVHIDNMQHLLTHGILNKSHENADPKYIKIGDSDLIIKRNDYPVGINPPGGMLGDYVPFYLGPLSPMLYNIKTGFGGIKKQSQSDIIYVVCKATNIVRECKEWCFTDGHAKKAISEFYNDLKYIGEVDWDIVKAKYWHNTEDDFDRMRRKQAEFLVKDKVPVSCISGIAVYDEKKRILLEEMIKKLGLHIPVKIIKQYYY
jgi:hypothetical protein